MYNTRKLALYDDFTLEYYDPQNNQLKGSIALTPQVVIENKDSLRW